VINLLTAGTATVIVVAFCNATFAASVPPNVTSVAPAKLVPVIVTLVPPAVRPELGLKISRRSVFRCLRCE
jgi:hypothetical protein